MKLVGTDCRALRRWGAIALIYSPQAFWNQHAIKDVEEPLHQQRQQCRGNSSLQDRCVIVQIKAAQDRLAETSGTD